MGTVKDIAQPHDRGIRITKIYNDGAKEVVPVTPFKRSKVKIIKTRGKHDR